MTFCVGLTGGIGCGKSKAADMFAELGARVIDTDAISHALTKSGGKAMPQIEREFGPRYLSSDGSLDRAAMRALVFADAGAKLRLESILHPMIRSEVEHELARAEATYVVLVVPLLFETGAYRDTVDRVLVVDCPEDEQVTRTMARSQLAEPDVRAIMSAQIPRAKRIEQADDVLVNDADMATLRARVRALHERYSSAARASVGRG